jgi:hypothetical protein
VELERLKVRSLLKVKVLWQVEVGFGLTLLIAGPDLFIDNWTIFTKVC